ISDHCHNNQASLSPVSTYWECIDMVSGHLRVLRSQRRRTQRRLRHLAFVEQVEERLLLATIIVSTSADVASASTLTLRQAIEIADGTLAISSLTSQQQA